MGYPADILSTRAVVKHGNYAVIPPEGLVNNQIPGLEGCRVSIVASPKMGASFVEYLLEVAPGGGTSRPFGREAGIETFFAIVEGEGLLGAGEELSPASAGAYQYAPPGTGLSFCNNGTAPMKALRYKQRFQPAEGLALPAAVRGNYEEIPYREYDQMANVWIKDLLPVSLEYDMNFHILSFAPGGCHPFVETHVQEHGAYVLEGEGCYLLDQDWQMIKKGDFLWFGPYVAQAAYGVGRSNFTYLYSKDCNRDPEI